MAHEPRWSWSGVELAFMEKHGASDVGRIFAGAEELERGVSERRQDPEQTGAGQVMAIDGWMSR